MAPTANRIVRVVHQSPTRIRLRVGPGDDTAILAADITDALTAADGVVRVTPNETTHAVLVELERARLSPQSALATLRDAGIVVTGNPPELPVTSPDTTVGSTISQRVSSVNEALNRSTRGLVDLREVFPLTLLGFGVSQVLRGSLRAIPWYTLLYYGYSTFSALHARRSGPEPDAREILRRRYADGKIGRAEFLRMMRDLDGEAT